jgi:hypothetical protein
MDKSSKILADSIDTLIEQNEHLVKELVKLRAACDAVDEENAELMKEINRLKYQIACLEASNRAPRYRPYNPVEPNGPYYNGPKDVYGNPVPYSCTTTTSTHIPTYISTESPEPKYWSVEEGVQF